VITALSVLLLAGRDRVDLLPVGGSTADIEAEQATGRAVVILTTKSPPEPFDDR
jgi:hypothetical protein